MDTMGIAILSSVLGFCALVAIILAVHYGMTREQIDVVVEEVGNVAEEVLKVVIESKTHQVN
jgi:choline-glycine betaine transporter